MATQTISFYGSQLITLKVDDVIYTAVKPIVEALGLSWSSQHRKLENSKGKFNCAHMSIVAEDGKLREMLCMPLKKLNGWLFSINPEKVRSDLKEKVIQYQEECFEVLYNYWYHGKAERKTTTDERTGLRQAVSQLVSKKGLIYSDAYSFIHQRFNVQHIDELTAEQIPMAVEYIHKIVLEGELITDTSSKTHGILLDEEAFYVVAKAIAKLNESTFEWEKIMDLFSELESHRNYKTAFNLGVASYNLAQSSEKIIMKNLVQMRNKVWKKEIEDFIFSNPHLQNHTENKLVHYLR
ncbi:phage antirepressor N-terminal domain-containing protein [Pasteurella multocida]|uniref:phage antirepressor N-terminal domain-containing protein n=1 Tax=Pasteurella multocida TaxID=747 RepID=UPI00210064DD|nr:phage antirepressor N-terminal domain-containing protein [Pasteurella multocida]MDY0488995.1 phage antirepressor N-terminal domain-containing protein [Pasteurella multocida]MDY0595796.1 phage antirepressor N-terminal domain-containing protein [Pasteurella multocida]MDY0632340.1 phage antirepressor N-terminal domain-containing protein [Pasteurella multocida]MDY0665197.1 phage antirepressor N-terminal domain-containing protein [Pasteurella multocida]MDY0667023.1 phage antirepressor N-terminal